MANYQNLIAAVDAVIKTNNRREITGQILQNVLNQMIGSLGENMQLAGFADPLTDPHSPDQNVFYFATQAGVYQHFNNIVLDDGFSVLMWKNGQWTANTLEIAVTRQWVQNNFVTIDFFRRLFRAFSSSDVEVLPNDMDSVIDHIKVMFGLWTEEYLSALGLGQGGGGSIGARYLTDLLDVYITDVQNGQALIYSSALEKWINGAAGVDMTTVWAALAANTNEQINVSHLANFVPNKLAPLASITFGGNYLQFKDHYAEQGTNVANAMSNPGGDWYYHIIMNHANDNGYYFDLAACFHYDYLYYRRIVNGTAQSWVRIIDSSNIGSQSVNYANSAGSASYASTAGAAYDSSFYINGTSADNPRLVLHIPGIHYTRIQMGTDGNIVVADEGSPSTYRGITAAYFYSTNYVTALSDIRKKDVVDRFVLKAEVIAKASLILFTWKDKHNTDIHAGGIAQEWEKILPEAVQKTADGDLAMDYGVIGMVSAVSLAREVVRLQKTVKAQEKKIQSLEARLARLEKMFAVNDNDLEE